MRIISGGQTGVDRAALDTAIKLGISVSGFIIRGRKAEDGVVDSKYKLTEIHSNKYEERTLLNIFWSEITLILYKSTGYLDFDGGTRFTYNMCKELNKKMICINITGRESIEAVVENIYYRNIKIINVAGPRESKIPGIYLDSCDLLTKIFKKLKRKYGEEEIY